MYQDPAAHLDTLDHLASATLKQAYLALLLQTSAAGLDVRLRQIDGVRELLFRDSEGRQPCAAVIDADALLFCLRRPILEWQPGLAAAAINRFEAQLVSDPANTAEVRVRLQTPEEVEEMIAFLRLKPRLVSLGYAARISA